MAKIPTFSHFFQGDLVKIPTFWNLSMVVMELKEWAEKAEMKATNQHYAGLFIHQEVVEVDHKKKKKTSLMLIT